MQFHTWVRHFVRRYETFNPGSNFLPPHLPASPVLVEWLNLERIGDKKKQKKTTTTTKKQFSSQERY
jgi:hypothetical protein